MPAFLALKPLVMVGAGLASTALLASVGTGTFSVFTASVTGSGKSSTFGTLVMEVATDSAKCLSTADGPGNSATCEDVQEFGGRTDLLPGDRIDSTVVVRNVGTLEAATLTLSAGKCDATTSPDYRVDPEKVRDVLCDKTRIVIEGPDGVLFEGAPRALADQGVLKLRALGAGEAEKIRFHVDTVPVSDNAFQGTGFQLPLTWTFTGHDGG